VSREEQKVFILCFLLEGMEKQSGNFLITKKNVVQGATSNQKGKGKEPKTNFEQH
jgi:hypothetical protein